MTKTRLLGIVLGTACIMSVGVIGTTVTSNSTTMGSETELAGMSCTLEKFCSLQSGLGSNPEAIVAFADMMAGNNAEPGTEEQMTGDDDVKDKSEYANIGISIAADYVNIRKEPDTDAKIVGKLYRGSAATIVKDEGDWVYIQSGSVDGYIKKDYLAIGYSAEKLIDEFGTKWATIITETLKVRETGSMDAIVLTLVQEDESYPVVKEETDWVKINVDEDCVGYVSKEYVKITVQFKKAVSIEEEREEKRRKEAAEAAARDDRNNNNGGNNNNSNGSGNRHNGSSNGGGNKSNHSGNGSGGKSGSGSGGGGGKSGGKSGGGGRDNGGGGGGGGTVASGDGEAIASYGLQFVGNPYVYGGTSLTHGTDCSGFTMSVFKHFGISLPRTSGEQSKVGKKISWKDARAGDLIFYGSGGHVGHVALCIGGGRVVHASNPSSGIKTSPINYRTPVCARRVLG
ncbi:MAG: C40 family peptidase [Eubacterium sp.]|nr:C40 family peptidase [Eubacterium sp.]